MNTSEKQTFDDWIAYFATDEERAGYERACEQLAACMAKMCEPLFVMGTLPHGEDK